MAGRCESASRGTFEPTAFPVMLWSTPHLCLCRTCLANWRGYERSWRRD